MQMNGSAKVSAPRCTSYSATIVASSDGGNLSNGDSTLQSAATAGENSLTLVSDAGFPASGVLIVGYGTANEEEVAFTTGEGVSLDTNLLKDHAVNERVVVKPTVSLMPGTVSITVNGTQCAEDDGFGSLVGAGAESAKLLSGSVDYSTGLVKIELDTLTDDAVAMTASVLSDAPSAEGSLADGSAAHKTFQQYAFTKNDTPGAATVSNLGDATVGFFFEVSRNGGKSFTSAGLGASGSVGSFGTVTVKCPGGSNQVVRFRAGSQTVNSDFEDDQRISKDPEGRIIEPRVVTVDTATNLNHG